MVFYIKYYKSTREFFLKSFNDYISIFYAFIKNRHKDEAYVIFHSCEKCFDILKYKCSMGYHHHNSNNLCYHCKTKYLCIKNNIESYK